MPSIVIILFETIFFGEGIALYCGNTGASTRWSSDCPKFPYDPVQARALLDAMGMVDRDGDGFREDPEGNSFQFSVKTFQEKTVRVKALTSMQEDLAKVELNMNPDAETHNAFMASVGSSVWEALFVGFVGPLDPIETKSWVHSSARMHIWNAEQKTPATDWEAENDAMLGVLGSNPDHQARYDAYARILDNIGRYQALIYTHTDYLYVGVNNCIGNAAGWAYHPHGDYNLRELYLKCDPDAKQAAAEGLPSTDK